MPPPLKTHSVEGFSLHALPSATSEVLLLSAALLQRECLSSLFSQSIQRAGGDTSAYAEETPQWETDSCLWAIRLSVGLPDVPTVSFREVTSVSSPLKDSLPSLQLLQAEASLVSSLSRRDRERRDGGYGGAGETGKIEALETVKRLSNALQPRRCLLISSSQRLLHVLQQLLRLIKPHSLQRQLFKETPVSVASHLNSEETALAPAGEFLLAVMRLCLQQHAAAARRQQHALLRRQEAARATREGGDRQGDSAVVVSPQSTNCPQEKGPAADPTEDKLKEYLLRLRAEREALETLQCTYTPTPCLRLP